MMKAYKLFEIDKKGRLYSLFINKRDNPIKPGVWLEADTHPTKGFAVRTGWHCCKDIYGAPHLKLNPKNGRRRVWAVVEIDGVEGYDRPASQGGLWYLAQRMRVESIVAVGPATFDIQDCRGNSLKSVCIDVGRRVDYEDFDYAWEYSGYVLSEAGYTQHVCDGCYDSAYRVKFIGWGDYANVA